MGKADRSGEPQLIVYRLSNTVMLWEIFISGHLYIIDGGIDVSQFRLFACSMVRFCLTQGWCNRDSMDFLTMSSDIHSRIPSVAINIGRFFSAQLTVSTNVLC